MPPKRRFSTLRKALLGHHDHDQDHPGRERQTEVSDLELQLTFPPKVRSPLSLPSYTNLNAANTNEATTSSGFRIASGGQHSDKSIHKLFPTQSYTQSHYSNSLGAQAKRRQKHTVVVAASSNEEIHGKHHIYAGVTHSDLDIQQTRPPLMFQMDIVEWLMLQSSQAHRVILMILAALLFTAIVNLVFGSIIFAEHEKDGNPYICKTKACRTLGKRLLSTLNRSVDPCEDFYAFVCGRSDFIEDATQEERDFWSFRYQGGRIVYDFHKSTSLGKMFKKTTKFPDNQILPFYRSCLDVVAREEAGLQPFYDALKKFGLYDVKKDNAHTADQVINAMVHILGHGYKVSGIIRDVYYYDSNAQRPIILLSSSLPLAYATGKVSMYGYEAYRDTVKNTFKLLSELNVNNDELDILAHDIVCLELLLRDSVVVNGSDVLLALKGDAHISGKTCDFSNGSIPANFGKKPDGNFNYSTFVQKMSDLMNLDSSSSSLPILADGKSIGVGNQKFLHEFEFVFNHSAPYRLLRYLQWRFFYTISSDLNQEAMNTTLPVKRHFFWGVPYCIQRLFNRMPFVAPERFLNSMPVDELSEVDREFNVLMERIRTTYHKVITRSQYKVLQEHLGRSFSVRDMNLLKEILATTMRTDDVLPVAYDDKNFPRYADLYEGILMNDKSFVENSLKLGYRFNEWRLVPKFMDIFYSIPKQLQVPVWVDKLQSLYNPVLHKFIVYLPFASSEPPFFREGLRVSDFSGAGLLYARAIEIASFSFFTVPDHTNELEHFVTSDLHINLLTEGYTLKEIRDMIKILKEFSVDYFIEKYLPRTSRWRKGSHSWNNFTYELTVKEEIKNLMQDQRRWQVIGVMMQDFLNNPLNWKHRKAVLEGLEEYNVEKLFYMTQVNRRCERLVKEKYDHSRKYGPLLDSIRENEALSNLYHFSKTFKCKVGSFMNPEDKLYFWDVDVNISNYHFNESKVPFFNND